MRIVQLAEARAPPHTSWVTSQVIEVDARGHRCPVPTLRLRRAVEAAPIGAEVRLLADDPLALVDIPHFARQAGVQLLETTAAPGGGSLFRLRVREASA